MVYKHNKQFSDLVLSIRGHIDFVFEDDRPFKQCHASTLIQARSGDLLCAWFAGTRERNADTGIWWSRFHTDTWTPPTLATKVNNTAHWNPILFQDSQGIIYLFFKVGPKIRYWRTYWIKSDDDGLSWTAPTELVPGDQGGRGPVKNKAIVLSDGSWLAPVSSEGRKWLAFADRSTDRGQTWVRSADFAMDSDIIGGKGAIQPTFWESSPGTVHALLRTAGEVIGRCDSHDFGQTWSAVYPSGLPNNNSGIDLVRLKDGRLVLAYNPIGQNWGIRTPLNLAVSRDNGVSWADIAHLETEHYHEFSYPAIIQTREGIAVSYTWKRERIRVWQIPLAALP